MEGPASAGPPRVSRPQLLQILRHFLRRLAARDCVTHQGNAVRALGTEQCRPGSEQRTDDVDLAEHGGDEDIEAAALADEILGDLAVAHVPGAADAHLEIA